MRPQKARFSPGEARSIASRLPVTVMEADCTMIAPRQNGRAHRMPECPADAGGKSTNPSSCLSDGRCGKVERLTASVPDVFVCAYAISRRAGTLRRSAAMLLRETRIYYAAGILLRDAATLPPATRAYSGSTRAYLACSNIAADTASVRRYAASVRNQFAFRLRQVPGISPDGRSFFHPNHSPPSSQFHHHQSPSRRRFRRMDWAIASPTRDRARGDIGV